MDIKQVYVAAFSVAGLKVRTFNHAEQSAESAKIGPMWGRFYSEGLAARIGSGPPASAIYGVYSGYESDASGAFDVTAGVAVVTAVPGFQTVRVEGGEYLVFESTGPMPDVIVQTWQRIWSYFEANPQIKRRFVTDFEAYTGPDAVAVHIGLA
ncbi:GyrI-like domain-containing protein [Pseudomonas sp. 14P_8.1_Bac3]|uniref:GyrI-like domain-containing protein n=1 Tax=Pseudomonas sp. 14P_8.1_Bac3 TaxID=2971621 RepID=UPI0021C6F836|nr:GyrI-like domain-containing protein [Pseudomonas sp. 14P_8.1_Bac3]MCU1761579.1 GyrI-like domain-containing protein [Pseudomonas sp. 14P_8.1_Bac3]